MRSTHQWVILWVSKYDPRNHRHARTSTHTSHTTARIATITARNPTTHTNPYPTPLNSYKRSQLSPPMRRTPIDLPDPTPEELERFLAKCRNAGTCIIWTGKTPRFYYSNTTCRPARLFWKLIYGTVPTTENLTRTCDTIGCIKHRKLTQDAYAA